MAEFFSHPSADISPEAAIGKGVKIWNGVQIRENAVIGDNSIIGKNSYIDTGVLIGKNVKIQNNVSVFHGVTISDGVFIGPHVCFTNDMNPRAITSDGNVKSAQDWIVSETLVEYGASIGANSTILPGITIGTFSMIGAGSVVTRNVRAHELVFGNPAKKQGLVCKCGIKMQYIAGILSCSRCSFVLKQDMED